MAEAGVSMISGFYDQTIILLDSDTGTTDPFDTSTAGYTTAASISAAVNQTRGGERFYGDGFTVRAEYKAYCEPTTKIFYGRRCRWNGDTFIVAEAPKNTLQKGHHYRFLLKEV
jgi:hypothetical protein